MYLARLLTENHDEYMQSMATNIETLNTSATTEYNDVSPGEYTNKYLIRDGINTALAADISSGKRMGDFGEAMLVSIATTGKMHIAPSEKFSTSNIIDTNEWSSKELQNAGSGDAFGGYKKLSPGGIADSVGVDAWIPTIGGWNEVTANLNPVRNNAPRNKIIDLGEAGIAASMKMSTATTSAGAMVIQPTKFMSDSGIADIATLLGYAFILEYNKANTSTQIILDADKISSPNSFAPEVAQALHNRGVGTLKFKGAAYNGGVVQ